MINRTLRIAVIAHGLRAGGGIAVAVNFLRSIIKARPHYTYLVVAPDSTEYRIFASNPQVRLEVFRHRGYLQRTYFDSLILPRTLTTFCPDVIFSLGNVPVRAKSTFQVLLIQNAYLVYPDLAIPGQRLVDRLAIIAQKHRIRRELDSINMIYCQTEAMRDRFLAMYEFRRNVLILPNSLSYDVTSESPRDFPDFFPALAGKFKLLALTRYYAHKNLESIIACFDRYRDELRDVVALLTIADDQHPNVRKLLADVKRRGLAESVINVGPISPGLLEGYYRQSDALLMPTLLESFSGTYLEAMAFGLPIITSDRDFSRALCKDSAKYFDPLSPLSMRDAILALKSDAHLRATLVESGLAQARTSQYSWDQIGARAFADVEGELTAFWPFICT